MSKKYEVATINDTKITIDISLLASDKLFFNATEIAKQFNRRPADFWKQEQNREYLSILVTLSEGNEEDFVFTKKGGKYQGTWLHKDLAIQFSRWLSPELAIRLDRWTVERLAQERSYKKERLEAKTGYLPMSNAVLRAHDSVKFYHFSNEANMINHIMFGMSASKFREKHEVPNVRDALDAAQLKEIARLQMINTGLIEVGMEYEERKTKLTICHAEGLKRLER